MQDFRIILYHEGVGQQTGMGYASLAHKEQQE